MKLNLIEAAEGSEEHEEQIYKDADVSPRVIKGVKSTRKENK